MVDVQAESGESDQQQPSENAFCRSSCGCGDTRVGRMCPGCLLHRSESFVRARGVQPEYQPVIDSASVDLRILLHPDVLLEDDQHDSRITIQGEY